MKELIKKITNLKKDDETFSAGSYDKALYDVLDIIQKQESKPFDPVECGFTEFEIDEKERYYKIHSGLVIVIEKDEKENSFILQSFEKKYSFDKSNLTKLLEEGECLTYMYFTAPNHRQGIELLRNLGKIE